MEFTIGEMAMYTKVIFLMMSGMDEANSFSMIRFYILVNGKMGKKLEAHNSMGVSKN